MTNYTTPIHVTLVGNSSNRTEVSTNNPVPIKEVVDTSAEPKPVCDDGAHLSLNRILEQVTTPLWYDPTTVGLKVTQTSAARTISSGTITSVTNIGGDASGAGPAFGQIAWNVGVRNLLT